MSFLAKAKKLRLFCNREIPADLQWVVGIFFFIIDLQPNII